MIRRIIFALSVALLGLAGIGAATPANASVTNYRSTGQCALQGTIWNTSVLYHRDSTTGNVQTYGMAVSRASGTGKLTELQTTWTDSTTHTLFYGVWPSGITSTGDQAVAYTPSWQPNQTIAFNLTSPGGGTNYHAYCTVNVT